MRKLAFAFLLWVPGTVTTVAQQPPQQVQDFSKVQVKVQKLAENVFVLQSSGVNAGMGNIGVFAGSDGIVLVDSQLVELGPKIDAALKTISDKPVKYVLNTHWHGDHTGGNAYWGKASVLIAHDSTPKTMQKEPDRRITNLPVSLPSVTFSNQFALHLNGSEVRAMYFGRAHTDGDVVVLFPGGSVIHMGDIFTNFDPPHFPALDSDNDGSGGPEGEIAAIEYVLAHAPEDHSGARRGSFEGRIEEIPGCSQGHNCSGASGHRSGKEFGSAQAAEDPGAVGFSGVAAHQIGCVPRAAVQ
jgi:cyclase